MMNHTELLSIAMVESMLDRTLVEEFITWNLELSMDRLGSIREMVLEFMKL